MDKNESHVLSLESLEEVIHLESEELCLRRAAAMKRLAGAAKDATTEEIGWNVEADRIAKEISEKNPRGDREGTHQRRHQDVRR